MSASWLRPGMPYSEWEAAYHRWPRPRPRPRDDPPEEKLIQRILTNRSASAAALAKVSSATKVGAEHHGLPCYPRKSPMRAATLDRVQTWRAGPLHGVLKVFIERAYGLESADINGLSDPFVEIRCGGQRRKTAVIEKTLEPNFEENFELVGILDDFVETGLRVQVFDWDPVGSPDALGEVLLPLHELRRVPHSKLVLKLSTSGFVVFSVTWVPAAAPPPTGTLGASASATSLSPQLVHTPPEPRSSAQTLRRQGTAGLATGASSSTVGGKQPKLPPVPVLLPSKFDWVSLTYHRKNALANMELKGTELVTEKALESNASKRSVLPRGASAASQSTLLAKLQASRSQPSHARSMRDLTRPASASVFEEDIFNTF